MALAKTKLPLSNYPEPDAQFIALRERVRDLEQAERDLQRETVTQDARLVQATLGVTAKSGELDRLVAKLPSLAPAARKITEASIRAARAEVETAGEAVSEAADIGESCRAQVEDIRNQLDALNRPRQEAHRRYAKQIMQAEEAELEATMREAMSRLLALRTACGQTLHPDIWVRQNLRIPYVDSMVKGINQHIRSQANG